MESPSRRQHLLRQYPLSRYSTQYTRVARHDYEQPPQETQEKNAQHAPACQNPLPAPPLAGDVTYKVRSWPGGSSTLQSHGHSFIFNLITDLVLAFVLALFLVLAIAARLKNGQPILGDKYESDLEHAMSLGPTIFPIIFAAVVSRTLKVAARYMAEKGTRLGILEMLMSSQTLLSAYTTQFLLRNASALGVLLLLIWSLSPIGGQASLRLLYRSHVDKLSTSPLKYMDTSPATLGLSYLSTGDPGYPFQAVNLLYSSVLLSQAPGLLAPRDIFGNVRIPRLPSNYSTSDPEGWYQVPNITRPEQYVSLLGTPIAASMPPGSANFSIESTQLTFDCDAGRVFNYSTDNWYDYLGIFHNSSANATFPQLPDVINPDFQASFFFDTYLNYSQSRTDAIYLNGTPPDDPSLQEERVILWGSVMDDQRALRNCSVSRQFVEAFIECSQAATKECAVSRLRTSTTNKNLTSVTQFDYFTTAFNLFLNFPNATMQGGEPRLRSSISSPTEWFMNDTLLSPFSAGREYGDVANTSSLSGEDFGARLSLVINTFWLAALAPLGFNGDPPALSDIPTVIQAEYGDNVNVSFAGAATTAQVMQTQPIWVCDMAWFAVLLICTWVTLGVSLAGIPLRLLTKAPDLLGNVSSLTYNNEHIHFNRTGTVGGMERARLLKDMRVKLGDVASDKEVGHIAFAADEPHVKPLSRYRLYR